MTTSKLSKDNIIEVVELYDKEGKVYDCYEPGVDFPLELRDITDMKNNKVFSHSVTMVDLIEEDGVKILKHVYKFNEVVNETENVLL